LLCLHDSIDWPVAFLGAIHAGVVPVPVNTLLTADEYEYMLQDSRARLAIVSASLLPRFLPLLHKVASLATLVVSGGDNETSLSMQHFMALTHAHAEVAPTTRDDMCFWLYSSGSTGRPKGTVHVHSSLMYTANYYACPILGIQESDVVFSAAKLFFAYGLGNSLTFPLTVGATSVLMAERATPNAVFRCLESQRVTIFSGVPTLYAAMLASPDAPDRANLSLRRCVSAGEALPEDIGKRWASAVGVDILDGIGSTEMLHIFLSNSPNDVRYGTTGKPVPGYTLRLIDEQGHEVAPGEHGELQICGPSGALMYWNNRERTRCTFLGEWTRSGDKFYQTPDGYFVYAGRIDDMLKVGGIYVSPVEVEAALISHQAVLEVAVVGRRDRDQLVKPVAYVVVRDGIACSDALAHALKIHVKSLLAPYKYPRWVEFIDELPKTATGKIQRFKLRTTNESC
ncbi:MAG: benzoate-CoA ligase family protein, partial [Pseudomonadota bacterium]|nr:benzoate-CoA ligase family protein [Pseudomonadota bacterium]